MNIYEPIVEVRGLTKTYGQVEALSGIDFEIRRGEIVSLLGPNGAGKSTTIEILEGYRQRSSGTVRVLGEDPEHATRAWRARIGIVLQSAGLPDEMTARELVAHFARFYPAPRNVDDVIDKMVSLKAKGVGFSLDDFGTGYSSLSYLKRLPLDQLKIAQPFVRDVLSDENDAAIATTIIALAQSFQLDVIAEGVETEAQRDYLSSVGCHAYQGYFFSRPLPLEDFERFARDF